MASRGSPEQNPTLRGRRLAMELQRRREATGMSREEVARQLEWSTSTLFRIETGRSRPQPGNVRTLLELYGVTGPERDGLIQLTRDARQPGWWHSFRDVLPNPYEVYIGLEAGAASIRNFEPVVVPGLAADRGLRSRRCSGTGQRAGSRRGRATCWKSAWPGRRYWPARPAAAVGGDRRGGHPRVVGGVSVMRGQLRHLAEYRPAGQDHDSGRAVSCGCTRRDDRRRSSSWTSRGHRPGRGVRRDAGRGHLPRRAPGCEPLYACI